MKHLERQAQIYREQLALNLESSIAEGYIKPETSVAELIAKLRGSEFDLPKEVKEL